MVAEPRETSALAERLLWDVMEHSPNLASSVGRVAPFVARNPGNAAWLALAEAITDPVFPVLAPDVAAAVFAGAVRVAGPSADLTEVADAYRFVAARARVGAELTTISHQ